MQASRCAGLGTRSVEGGGETLVGVTEDGLEVGLTTEILPLPVGGGFDRRPGWIVRQPGSNNREYLANIHLSALRHPQTMHMRFSNTILLMSPLTALITIALASSCISSPAFSIRLMRL